MLVAMLMGVHACKHVQKLSGLRWPSSAQPNASDGHWLNLEIVGVVQSCRCVPSCEAHVAMGDYVGWLSGWLVWL